MSREGIIRQVYDYLQSTATPDGCVLVDYDEMARAVPGSRHFHVAYLKAKGWLRYVTCRDGKTLYKLLKCEEGQELSKKGITQKVYDWLAGQASPDGYVIFDHDRMMREVPGALYSHVYYLKQKGLLRFVHHSGSKCLYQVLGPLPEKPIDVSPAVEADVTVSAERLAPAIAIKLGELKNKLETRGAAAVGDVRRDLQAILDVLERGSARVKMQIKAKEVANLLSPKEEQERPAALRRAG